ncbi:hypothetical protein ASE00_19060 [Sphingomonas sp. Root710]|nr:hypothetical protein ASE00_19060 [Sphingomonas sp. Root710]
MLMLLVLWLMAIVAVPGLAFLFRAWFGSGRWADFDLPTYLIAWAIVAAVEIFGIISLTGEPLSVWIVGFWSTIGAVAIGVVWWLSTKATQRDN